MSGPCAKQRVIAEIVTPDGARFYGENLCENPQKECPRTGLPTGVGYEMCRDICRQNSHAEVHAIVNAGAAARGATLILHGHSYACDKCKAAAKKAGIIKIEISGKTP
jgi:hypothetical protein